MPKIIGCIGHSFVKGITDQRYVKKQLIKRISKKYYDKDNIYLSGLKSGADTYFAELVQYLVLQFHAVLAVENQSEPLGRGDRIRFNYLLKKAHSVYEVYNIPEYKVKKKERKKLIEERGEQRTRKYIFLQASKFVVDISDIVIFVWSGRRVASNTYKALKYATEQNKETDVIHVSSRFLTKD